MKRPPFNPAILSKNRLYRQTVIVDIPATDSVSGSITITANRGDVRAVQVRVAGGTDAQYSGVTFDLDDNGVKFVINDNLLAYAPSYLDDIPRTIPIIIDENGILGFSFKNGGPTSTMKAIIVLLFWPPYNREFWDSNEL